MNFVNHNKIMSIMRQHGYTIGKKQKYSYPKDTYEVSYVDGRYSPIIVRAHYKYYNKVLFILQTKYLKKILTKLNYDVEYHEDYLIINGIKR